nr:glycosyltransferase [Lysobacter lactosilyticus]
MPVRDPDPRRLARAIASVQAQAYDRWELCIADDRSSDPNVKRVLSDLAFADPRIRVVWRMHRTQPSTTFNAALDIARGEHIALLAPDDALSEHALLCIAETIARKPRAAIVYSDEDCIDDDGQRRSPWCKPDWNRELFRGSGGLSHLGVFRTELVRRVGGFRPGFDGAEEFDLALRCVDATEPASIVHVPHILYHHRSPPATECNAHRREASELALADHFDRNGLEAVAAANDDATCTIQYGLPDPMPRVSIIVVDDASLLRLQRCIHVLRTQTDYKPVDILVATRRASPLRNASFTGVRWVRGANGSLADACNRAAKATSAELVVFIDSRCDRIARNWLRRLVSHAQLSHVGIVAPSCMQDGKAVGGGLVLGTKEGFSSRAQAGVAQQVRARPRLHRDAPLDLRAGQRVRPVVSRPHVRGRRPVDACRAARPRTSLDARGACALAPAIAALAPAPDGPPSRRAPPRLRRMAPGRLPRSLLESQPQPWRHRWRVRVSAAFRCGRDGRRRAGTLLQRAPDLQARYLNKGP